MTIKIVYKPSFLRQYRKLIESLREEAKEKIEIFRQDPSHPFLKTHKLKGSLKDFWSFSVNYQYRIIFQYEAQDKITLIAIDNHDIYK